MSNIIRFVKGDTFYCNTSVMYSDGTDFIIPDDCKIYLTVKRNYNSTPLIALNLQNGLELKDNKIEIKFTPEMTTKLLPGDYKYDVQLLLSTGDKFTVIANEKFILIPEITTTQEEV